MRVESGGDWRSNGREPEIEAQIRRQRLAGCRGFRLVGLGCCLILFAAAMITDHTDTHAHAHMHAHTHTRTHTHKRESSAPTTHSLLKSSLAMVMAMRGGSNDAQRNDDNDQHATKKLKIAAHTSTTASISTPTAGSVALDIASSNSSSSNSCLGSSSDAQMQHSSSSSGTETRFPREKNKIHPLINHKKTTHYVHPSNQQVFIDSKSSRLGFSDTTTAAGGKRKLSPRPPLSRNTLKSMLPSVVKIGCVCTTPNFAFPWQMNSQEISTSSGFVVRTPWGLRILTNAHAVAWGSSIRLHKHGRVKKYKAKVEHVSHSTDLALLDVLEPGFWDGLTELELGGIPELHHRVTVVGYPIGGDKISVTEGVVSRIEVTPYSHSGESFLAIQIDAAINAGNSGGPAFEGTRVVGVAFESLVEAENIGYIIPVPVIQHMIRDIVLHKQVTGIVRMGFTWQPLENPSMRAYYGLSNDEGDVHTHSAIQIRKRTTQTRNARSRTTTSGTATLTNTSEFYDGNMPDYTGILIRRVEPLAPVHRILKKGDVLLKFQGVPIGADGSVPLRDDERVLFTHLVATGKYIGDKVNLTIKRAGSPGVSEVEVELSRPAELVPGNLWDKKASYLIYAGLVFTSLSDPYLASEFGRKWEEDAPLDLIRQSLEGMPKHPDEEVVILSRVLVSSTNIGYEGVRNVRLEKVDGITVKSLRHLASILFNRHNTTSSNTNITISGTGNAPLAKLNDDVNSINACNATSSDHLCFEFAVDSFLLIVNRTEAEEQDPTILAESNIPARMSNDLKLYLENEIESHRRNESSLSPSIHASAG